MKAKIISPSSDHFQILQYLTGNLPLVITDTTHTLGPIGPHLNMSIHLHTQAHKVNIFLEINYMASILCVQEQEGNHAISQLRT